MRPKNDIAMGTEKERHAKNHGMCRGHLEALWGSRVGYRVTGVTKNESRKWPDGDRPWEVIYRRGTVNSF